MPVEALLPLIVVAIAFAAFCLWDISRSDSTRGLPKWGWAIASVVTIPLGGLLYLLFGRAR